MKRNLKLLNKGSPHKEQHFMGKTFEYKTESVQELKLIQKNEGLKEMRRSNIGKGTYRDQINVKFTVYNIQVTITN